MFQPWLTFLSIRHNSRPGLLRLATELRLQIYAYILCNHIVYVPDGEVQDMYGSLLRTRRAFGLLQACRQLYVEARHMFYTCNTFCFARCCCGFSADARFRLPQGQYEAIRAVKVLNCPSSHHYEPSFPLKTLLPNLRKVVFDSWSASCIIQMHSHGPFVMSRTTELFGGEGVKLVLDQLERGKEEPWNMT
jgi:hypothetical protein